MARPPFKLPRDRVSFGLDISDKAEGADDDPPAAADVPIPSDAPIASDAPAPEPEGPAGRTGVGGTSREGAPTSRGRVAPGAMSEARGGR